jgi:CBS domain containing-hemolysin-like protein
MPSWLYDFLLLGVAALLVVVNGFFVATEFALAKVRKGRLLALVREQRLFAPTAGWLLERLEPTLSACQLGITMASLALGWIGAPALAELMRPLFLAAGVQSEAIIHTISFVIAFSIISAAHLVIGEQGPKLFAIRNPENVLLWCAAPMKAFYIVAYPLLAVVNILSAAFLELLGLGESSERNAHHTEEEIRALLTEARHHGELSHSEHELLHAVFEFDDLICRRIMVPRNEVVICDVTRPMSEFVEVVRRTKHTRYPVCEGSLDHILGIVHIKDFVGMPDLERADVTTIMRPPKRVPGTLPISKVLRFFQKAHQLMAFVVNEYGTVIGVVTLENVVEEIVGPVDDEFDMDRVEIVADGPGRYVVLGGASVKSVNAAIGLTLDEHGVDTISGVLMTRLGRIPESGDRVELGDGALAEVLEVKDLRATRVRVVVPQP